jgi:hypothetical protein
LRSQFIGFAPRQETKHWCKILALNSLNNVIDKIILTLGLSLRLILPTRNKVLHKSNPHFRPQFELILSTHPPFSSKLSTKSTKVKITLQK